jgi:hypothetical protein
VTPRARQSSLRAALGRPWLAWAMLALACLAAIGDAATPRERDAAAAAQEAAARANVETALYNQPALLQRSIGALRPRDPDAINLYVLAIAGDGSQEVFRREVEFVGDELERMFHVRGHTITLINSRSTVATVPMATVTSIREALAAIAASMDRERDILFFFVTTHGSRDHLLVLDQPGMDLPWLSATQLATLLQASGIRWKVVVVSACYSGGFIEPLRDEHTLIITASRADRSSFGCADENELTDFGRAYFKEALPQSSSFQDAFRRAQKLVDAWEARDADGHRVRHSLPQIDDPPAVEAYLARWWSQARAPR